MQKYITILTARTGEQMTLQQAELIDGLYVLRQPVGGLAPLAFDGDLQEIRRAQLSAWETLQTWAATEGTEAARAILVLTGVPPQDQLQRLRNSLSVESGSDAVSI